MIHIKRKFTELLTSIDQFYRELKRDMAMSFRTIFCVILFIVIPIILLIFYDLAKDPELLKFFKFNPEHPTIYNMFLSNYTHESWDIHLIPNLVNYYILIFLIFLFEINRKKLYIEMAFLFLMLPFVITTIYIIFHANPGLGISGINFGLNGYLLHCMYGYFRQNRNILKELTNKRSKIDWKKVFILIMLIIALDISFQRFNQILFANNVPAHSIGYFFGITTPFLVDFIILKNSKGN